MNARRNKYDYLWITQANYGHGWEDVAADDNARDAKQSRLDYVRNDYYAVSIRTIRRRVLAS